MSQWISIDPTLLEIDERQQVAGVEIVVGLSPYEIPSEIRGFYDDNIRRFVIEFKYPLGARESNEQAHLNDHVTLFVGKESGCLYRIHVDVDRVGANAVGLQVQVPQVVNQALKVMADSKPSATWKRYCKVLREVVEERSPELLATAN